MHVGRLRAEAVRRCAARSARRAPMVILISFMVRVRIKWSEQPSRRENDTVAWVALVIAGLFEVGWATSMKLSEGFSRLWPSVATIVLMFISFGLLSYSMRSLPLGTAYGVWTGIGAVGSVVVGILFMGESRDPVRLLCITLILVGIVGLRLTSAD